MIIASSTPRRVSKRPVFTSKANFVDRDMLPVYDKKDNVDGSNLLQVGVVHTAFINYTKQNSKMNSNIVYIESRYMKKNSISCSSQHFSML